MSNYNYSLQNENNMKQGNHNTVFWDVIGDFFIVPSRILELPGLTLVYLRVYEIIFQFWNNGNPCSMSSQLFLDRLHIGRSQLFEAFLFFERNGELIRTTRNGKRYLIQPDRHIEEENNLGHHALKTKIDSS